MTDLSSDFSKPKNDALPPPKRARTRWVNVIPWWAVFMGLLGIYVIVLIASNEDYTRIFDQLTEGILLTIRVSALAYISAILLGGLLGIIRSYPPDGKSGAGRVIAFHVATFYVELFRGLPILVVMLIITFVVIPSTIQFWNALPLPQVFEINQRLVTNEWRAIAALALTYGAFLSEVFRAGIQSVDRGQREAAQALGLRPPQIMTNIILPQAIRRVLPPLGNDFVAMIKDSSLVAILAVRDITQIAKLSSGQSFMYLETYLVAAAIYLFMTISGSLLVRQVERTLATGESPKLIQWVGQLFRRA
ncbi:MAG: amino acid ABC transporter permease [Phototrophicaceae bacterium]|jgi:ABC-type amino acid transport system permease subunit